MSVKAQQTLLKQTEVLGGYDMTRYTMERAWATASDGVKVPVSLVYRKDLPRDWSAPLYLKATGPTGRPRWCRSRPTASACSTAVWCSASCAHQGRRRSGQGLARRGAHDEEAQHVHRLHQRGRPPRGAEVRLPRSLGDRRGSAGGLLIGAVVNLRPDVAKAAILQVPFVDVINTMLDETLPLTVAEFEEWGNPRNKDEYDYLKTYCPYTNLEARAYPAMLVKTSLNDSQVPPLRMPCASFASRLRSMQ